MRPAKNLSSSAAIKSEFYLVLSAASAAKSWRCIVKRSHRGRANLVRRNRIDCSSSSTCVGELSWSISPHTWSPIITVAIENETRPGAITVGKSFAPSSNALAAARQPYDAGTHRRFRTFLRLRNCSTADRNRPLNIPDRPRACSYWRRSRLLPGAQFTSKSRIPASDVSTNFGADFPNRAESVIY